jgi:hypothetical protein
MTMKKEWYEVRSSGKEHRCIRAFEGGVAYDRAVAFAQPYHDVIYIEIERKEMKLAISRNKAA